MRRTTVQRAGGNWCKPSPKRQRRMDLRVEKAKEF